MSVRPSVRPSVHLPIHLPSVMSVLHPSVHWLACLYFIVFVCFFSVYLLVILPMYMFPSTHPAHEFSFDSVHYASLHIYLHVCQSVCLPSYQHVCLYAFLFA